MLYRGMGPDGSARHCNCVALIVNVAGTKKMQAEMAALRLLAIEDHRY
jgi:hypothetical protein